MITSPIKAILIDFDGTLFDTELANAKAYQEAILSVGLSINIEKIASVINGQHFSFFLPKLLGEKCSPFLIEKITMIKRKIYPNYFSLIRPNNGLISLVKKLSNNGIQIALVSNASKASVISVLNYFELIEAFDFVVSSDDVNHPKPSSICYEYAMNLMGINSEQCIAFEDSQVGVDSAKKAGIAVIRVSLNG